MRNTHSYQAISNAQVLTLHIDDWGPLLQHFPESKKIIYGGDDGADDEKGGNEDENIKVNFPSQDTHGAANAPAPSPTKPAEFALLFGGPSNSLTFDPLEQTSTNLLGHPSDSQSSVKFIPRSSSRKSSIHSDVRKDFTSNFEWPSITADTQISATSSLPKLIYTVTSTNSAASSELSDLKPKSALNPLLRPNRPTLEESMQMPTTISLVKLTSVDPAATRQFPDFKSSSTFSILPRHKRPSITDETQISLPLSLLKLTPIGASTDPSALASKAALKPLIESKGLTIAEGTLMSAPPTSSKLILKSASESPLVPTLKSVIKRPTATKGKMTPSPFMTSDTPLTASPQLLELLAPTELSCASMSTMKEPVPSQTTLKAQSVSNLSIKYESSRPQKKLPARLTTSTNVDIKHVIFDKLDQPLAQPSFSRPRYMAENIMVETSDISSSASEMSPPSKDKRKLSEKTDQENTKELNNDIKKLKTDSDEGINVDIILPIKSDEIADFKMMTKFDISEISIENDSNDVQFLKREPDIAKSANVEKENGRDPLNLSSDINTEAGPSSAKTDEKKH